MCTPYDNHARDRRQEAEVVVWVIQHQQEVWTAIKDRHVERNEAVILLTFLARSGRCMRSYPAFVAYRRRPYQQVYVGR